MPGCPVFTRAKNKHPYWEYFYTVSHYNQASVPGPMFGFMSTKAHQADIALSELMTNIVQQGSRLGPSQTSPSLYPHYKSNFSSLTLCQVLSGRRERQINWGRSRTDSALNGSWLWVGDDVIDKHGIALDLLVQFKL